MTTDTLRCRLYEPGFVYVKHEATDIRKLFERVRAEQAKQQKTANVRQLKKAGK